jgi:hypothetical protein
MTVGIWWVFHIEAVLIVDLNFIWYNNFRVQWFEWLQGPCLLGRPPVVHLI